MNYTWDFTFLWAYRWLLLSGLGISLAFTIVTNVVGMAIGMGVGLARSGRRSVFTLPLTAYVEAFRCTPLLVQLVWIYYALPVVLGVDLSATQAAGITLSLYAGAFYAEIFRAGIASVGRGQWDAGRAVGLRWWPTMRYVVLPQAVRRMVPPMVSQTIMQLKNTSLVSTVAVADLLYQGSLITAATYRPLEVYTTVAVIYFIVLFPLTVIARSLELRVG